jgi:hypothetical protein
MDRIYLRFFFHEVTMKSIALASLLILLLSLPAYGQRIAVSACGADLNVERGSYVLTCVSPRPADTGFVYAAKAAA